MNERKKNIISIYDNESRKRWGNLPEIICKTAEKYNLSDLEPVNNMAFNYVTSGYRSEKPIILKLGLDNEALMLETTALKCFYGYGAIKVLAEDKGMLLLERALPGITLKSYFPTRERESIEIACRVMQKLHKARIPESHGLPHVKDRLAALDKDLQIPFDYLNRARKLRDRLLETAGPDVLLHGDLHHDNILQYGNDWSVIDPKGVIGDAAYEAAVFIINPMPELLNIDNPLGIIQNRIECFASLLDIPAKRIFDCCFVQAVLCWIWALEDGCDTGYFRALIKLLERININRKI